MVYRNSEIRKYQVFAYTKWVGGLFGSPGVTGSRPGENISFICIYWAMLLCFKYIQPYGYSYYSTMFD